MTHDTVNHILQSPTLLGESLKRLRISRDMTVQHAAERAGLSKSFLSLVESGKRRISFADALRLVHTLKMSLGQFVSLTRDSFSQSSLDAPLELAMTTIVRPRKEGLLLAGKRTDTAPRLILLRPLRHEHDLELLELFLPPTSQLTEEPVTTLPAAKNLTREVRGVVHAGMLLVLINNDEYRVGSGDEFCFDGTLPHLYRNYTNEPVTASLLYVHAGL